MAAPSNRDTIARLLDNLDDELNGAALYDVVASVEKNPQLAEVYRKLAEVERRHAETWRKRLVEAGTTPPSFRPSWRTRTLGFLARRFGAGAVLPMAVRIEQADSRKLAAQPDAGAIEQDSRSHTRILRHLSRSAPNGVQGSEVARLEGRHRSAGGNALRAAVLGANDGLVSNLSLVMGVAGAALAQQSIVVTGLAGLLAGAASMALGEWLSVQSSRELYEQQIRAEEEEIGEAPEEEAEELALIYQARGLEKTQARTMADQIMSNPASAIETMAREELGIDPEELGGSAWTAAATSFFLFAVGAIIPVVPFFFAAGARAVGLSLAFSTAGLFLLGSGITLFTGKPILWSGSRQVLFGLAAAALTFGIGRLIGVTIAG